MKFILRPLERSHSILERIINKINRELFINPARRKISHKLIDSTPPYPNDAGQEFSIHTLIGANYVEMAIAGFKVFNYVCGINFKITIHDDGSLTNIDIKRLNHHLNCIIILRNEADKKAKQELINYPRLFDFRSAQVMALKLIDVKLFSRGARIAYIDVDILFFRYPEFFIQTLSDQSEQINYFNKDIDNAYIENIEVIEKATGLHPLEKANAGLWVINAKDIDLGLAESWLAKKYFQPYTASYRLEQTLISILANTSEKGATHLPSSYDVELLKLPENSVCKHYVGRIRHGYELEGLQYILDNVIKKIETAAKK
jgi:hypothetical protein